VTAPTPNAALAYRVLDHIDAHPEEWDQTDWQCGTSACFAGWAIRFSGGVMDNDIDGTVVAGPAELIGMVADSAALKVLRITDRQAGWNAGEWLFSDSNTREDLGRLVAEIFGPRPDGGVVLVDHGPVKPPYGTPEREAYDPEHGGAPC
jgi:hypothetical protein